MEAENNRQIVSRCSGFAAIGISAGKPETDKSWTSAASHTCITPSIAHPGTEVSTMYRHEPGVREYPCPDESCSLEEAIQGQLEEMDEKTVASFIAYCNDRIDDFLKHEANRRREHAEEIKREAA